jgi:cell cycle checkpoint protein
MAPPAKRRKRSAVEESSDYGGEAAEAPAVERKKPTGLHRYLLSSPNAKPSSTSAPEAIAVSSSPSLAGKTTRDLGASQAAAGPSTSTSPSPSPSTRTSNLRTSTGRVSKPAFKSPSTSPEKARNRIQQRNGKVEEKGRTADLKTLFSKQAEKAQANGAIKAEFAALEELVSDPISDDDEIGMHRAARSSLVGRNVQKRFMNSSQNTFPSSSSRMGGAFLKPPRLQGAETEDDQRPWSERFGPTGLEELAVHKKKVADVRGWLEEVIAGRRRQRLLVLKGAAGTGKTTTVKLLARAMRCEVLEWKNPVGSLGATQGYASASAQFDEFMGRSGKFGQLDLENDTPQQAGPTVVSVLGHAEAQKLVLIEEFPNTFLRSSTALTAFKSSVLGYLAANVPPLATLAPQTRDELVTPLVMIVSETLLTTASASADSFTAYRLLGPEILQHPGTCVIEFNPIAPTLMTKALDIIVQKESHKSGRRKTPGLLVLQRLGEIGDIRSAISSLEFLCLKGDNEADWGGKVVFAKPRKGSKTDGAAELTKGEEDSLQLISQRESTLGIFHAVGKVVYNKRDETSLAVEEQLPSFLKYQARPKKSLVVLETLMDETGTDTNTFISALHENYVLSCEHSNPADRQSPVDYVSGCIEYLSDCDLMSPSWDSFFGNRGFPGSFYRDQGSHVVRQDEIAFQVAVRGILFSLPSPVKRQAPHGGRGGDVFKMFYPTSLKLWAAKLLKGEPTGLVPVAATTSTTTPLFKSPQKPSQTTHGPPVFRRAPKSSGNSSAGDWATKKPALNFSGSGREPARQPTGQSSAKEEQDQPKDDNAAAAAPLLALGSAARSELLLDRLPYMALIARGLRRRGLLGYAAGSGQFGPNAWRELDRVVSLQGIGNTGPDEEAADEDWKDDASTAVGSESWFTDWPTEEGSSPRRRGGLGAILRRAERKMRGPAAAAMDESLTGTMLTGPVTRLVLSDDDIEDD